jgi:hypothetical protein
MLTRLMFIPDAGSIADLAAAGIDWWIEPDGLGCMGYLIEGEA